MVVVAVVIIVIVLGIAVAWLVYCEQAATPGGLNEQSLGFLRQSEHFSLQEQSLQAILNRLSNKKWSSLLQ